MMMEDVAFDTNDQGMDDIHNLFFDETLPNAMPTLPEQGNLGNRDLLYRIDELCLSGCNQKIAWSRNNCIAYISHDRRTVKLQPYPIDTTTKPSTLDTRQVHGDDQEIVNISWDHQGQSLMVVDIAGRISIHRSLHAVNHASLMGKYLPGKSDPGSGIVGMRWIPARPSETDMTQMGSRRLVPEAVLHGDRWQYPSFKDTSQSWTHPVTDREALLFATRDNVVHLMTAQYRQNPRNNDLYAYTKAQLISTPATSSLLTHVSFASQDENDMLAVTLDLSGELRTYRLRIEWNIPKEEKPTADTQIYPSIEVKPLATTSLYAEFSEMKVHRVTQLLFLHATDLPQPVGAYSPEILVVGIAENLKSRIFRFSFETEQELLHPSFQALHPKRSKSATKLSTSVTHAKDSVELPSCCVSVRTNATATLITLYFSDVLVEVRSRGTLEQVASPKDHDTSLRCLTEAGFRTLGGSDVTALAVSPNDCAIMTSYHDLDLDNIDILSEVLPGHEAGANPTRIEAALAASFASAGCSERNADDLYSVIEQNSQQVDVTSLLNELHIATGASNVRTITEHMFLYYLPGTKSCLVAQYELQRRLTDDLSSKRLAWLFIDVLHMCRSLDRGYQQMKQNDGSCFDLPPFLIGLVSWYIKTCTYLTKEVLHLSTERGSTHVFDAIKASPGLRFLLSGWGRSFITMISRSIHNILKVRQDLHQAGMLRTSAFHGWMELINALQAGATGVREQTMYWYAITEAVNKCYEAVQVDDEAKMKVERGIVITGEIPEYFGGAIEAMIGKPFEALLEAPATDPTRVFFAQDYWQYYYDNRKIRNTSQTYGHSTRVDESAEGEHGDGEHWIDVINKTVLIGTKGAIRRCIRCGSCTSVFPSRVATNTWLTYISRHCICGGSWMALEAGEW